jgi:hypothetical protein
LKHEKHSPSQNWLANAPALGVPKTESKPTGIFGSSATPISFGAQKVESKPPVLFGTPVTGTFGQPKQPVMFGSTPKDEKPSTSDEREKKDNHGTEEKATSKTGGFPVFAAPA